MWGPERRCWLDHSDSHRSNKPQRTEGQTSKCLVRPLPKTPGYSRFRNPGIIWKGKRAEWKAFIFGLKSSGFIDLQFTKFSEPLFPHLQSRETVCFRVVITASNTPYVCESRIQGQTHRTENKISHHHCLTGWLF